MNIEESYKAHNNTSKEIGNALISNNFDNSLDYAEIALDEFVTDGILKEIPIVKTVVGVVKSGLKAKEIYFSKKILTFLKEFHSGKLPQDNLERFQKKFKEDKKYRDEVVEQIMIFNDSFLQTEKSKIFANLFASYINGQFDWNNFINLSLCLNQMNLNGISLFHDMENFKNPFHGTTYDDVKQRYALLLNSGTISIIGNHLEITVYGMYIYHYGIKGNISEYVVDAYPDILKREE